MNKRLFLILLICSLVLCACGKRQEEPTIPTETIPPVETIDRIVTEPPVELTDPIPTEPPVIMTIPPTEETTAVPETTIPATSATEPPQPSQPDVDTYGPIILSITTDRADYAIPDTVTVTVEAMDERSDIASLRVWFYNPGKNTQYCAVLQPTESGFIGFFNLEETAEEGTYTLWEICAADTMGNVTDLLANDIPDDLYITFSAAVPADTVAPSIHGVYLDKETAVLPDEITVTVDTTDADSGVASVTVAFADGSLGNILSLSLNPDTNGMYSGTFSFDDSTVPGTYGLYAIYAVDNVGNETKITATEIPASLFVSFTVIHPESDETAPVIRMLVISAEEMTLPGNVTIAMDASDEGSGIVFARVSFFAPDGKTQYFVDLLPANDGLYYGTLSLPADAAPGMYTLQEIFADDAAGNRTYLCGSDIPESLLLSFTAVK